MSDDTKVATIERGIDRQIAEAMTITRHGGSSAVAPTTMVEAMEMAKFMSISGICIRPVFRGNPGACLAIIMQAMKWGADPFAVANKAYEVNNQLAYEAQLVHAIVNSSPVLAKRLRPVYQGDGPNRRCRIVGYIVGEDDAFEYESPLVKDITVKNSPLWKSDPDQQLFYYSVRAWARRHVPEILLGIYTPDEYQGQTIEMEPQPEPRREDFVVPEHLRQTGRYYDVTDLDGEVHAFSDPHKAAAALRVVMSDASRQDVEVLDSAWSLNQPLIDEFDPMLRAELAGDYAELRDRVIETAKRSNAAVVKRHQEAARQAFAPQSDETPERAEADNPERKSDDADAEAVGTASATASGGSEWEAEARRTAAAEPQQRGPDSDDAGVAGVWGRPGVSAGGGATPAGGSGTAGGSHVPAEQRTVINEGAVKNNLNSPPTSDRPPPPRPQTAPSGTNSEQASPRAASPSAPAERPERGGVVRSSQAPPARDERTANSAADDDRPSQHIPVPTDPRTGKPNLRTWAMALFLPKIRRKTEIADLAWLMGDNDDSVVSCRKGALAGDDLSEFNKAISDAWESCK